MTTEEACKEKCGCGGECNKEEVATASPHGEVPLVPKAPYILVYDTQNNSIVGYHSWDKPVSLTVFKAAFAKAIEEHGDDYGRDLTHLAQAAHKTAAAMGNPKKTAFPADMAMSLVQRCQNRIEDAFRRMAEFQGGYGTELAVLLPYAAVATQGEGVERVVDVRNSKPLVNGFIYTAVYREEIGMTVPIAGHPPLNLEDKAA